MIGVVVPVHNEEATLEACLRSIAEAARCPRLHGETVRIYAALDACRDDSERIARVSGVTTLAFEARCVGLARALGAERAMQDGAHWIAFTDADSEVAPDWLAEQRALRADAVCGTVTVSDWGCHAAAAIKAYTEHYRNVDGHRHIHGANLGVSASAYQAVGGMPPLRENEDVAFVSALASRGFRITWSARPRVFTSSRTRNRVAHGFGGVLRNLYTQPAADAVPVD